MHRRAGHAAGGIAGGGVDDSADGSTGDFTGPAAGSVTTRLDGGGAEVGRSDHGNVTVEAAIALSALLVVLVMCMSGLAALMTQIRVTDAATTAARLAGRGDDAAARAAATRLAPAGAVLTLSGGDPVTAEVVASPWDAALPGLHLTARAVAAREPGADSPP